jgi:hypothetical protein
LPGHVCSSSLAPAVRSRLVTLQLHLYKAPIDGLRRPLYDVCGVSNLYTKRSRRRRRMGSVRVGKGVVTAETGHVRLVAHPGRTGKERPTLNKTEGGAPGNSKSRQRLRHPPGTPSPQHAPRRGGPHAQENKFKTPTLKTEGWGTRNGEPTATATATATATRRCALAACGC